MVAGGAPTSAAAVAGSSWRVLASATAALIEVATAASPVPVAREWCAGSRVVAVHRVPERVAIDEHLLVAPTLVVRTAKEDADAEVDVHQVGGDQLP